MTTPYDIVLWGATGFTGQLVAAYLARRAGTGVRWALAGRNAAKLEQVRRELAAEHPAAADLPILVGDSLDRSSLDAIVQQTRVVISAVGPYALYGTPLVAACAAHGVAYCDITGEVQWIRKNLAAFEEQAAATGARIVHCCGFDSVPSDLGVWMVQEEAHARFGRPCDAVQLTVLRARGGFSGGTVASMLNLLAETGRDRTLRRVLADPYALVPQHPGPRQIEQTGARWDADLRCWTGPFVMARINTRIVHRSNYLLGYRYGKQFHYGEAQRMGSGLLNGRLPAHALGGGILLFGALATLGPARRLLKRTVLPAPGEGPPQATRERGFFELLVLGKGTDRDGRPFVVRGEIAGAGDPGYNATARMLAETAVGLLEDAGRGATGGILTPAAALGSRLIERLRTADFSFTVAADHT